MKLRKRRNSKGRWKATTFKNEANAQGRDEYGMI